MTDQCVYKIALDKDPSHERRHSLWFALCSSCQGYDTNCQRYQGCKKIVNPNVLERRLRNSAGIMGLGEEDGV